MKAFTATNTATVVNPGSGSTAKKLKATSDKPPQPAKHKPSTVGTVESSTLKAPESASLRLRRGSGRPPVKFVSLKLPDSAAVAPRSQRVSLRLGRKKTLLDQKFVLVVESHDKGQNEKLISGEEAQKNELAKRQTTGPLASLLCGFLAGTVSKTACSPLEVAYRNVASGEYAKPNIFGSVKDILHRKGVQGLWAGNVANCARCGPNKAIQFLMYQPVVNACVQAGGGDMNAFQLALVGAMVGVVGTATVYPLDLLSWRQAVARPGTYKNAFHAVACAIRRGGPLELYRGIGPTMLMAMPYYGAQFGAFELARSQYIKHTGNTEISSMHTMLFGCFSGAAACTLSHPIELICRQIQVQAETGSTGKFKCMKSCIQHMYQTGGLRAFSKGLLLNNYRLIPATGIQFLIYELCQKAVTMALASKEKQAEVSALAPASR
eukprot:scaffold1206_cov388-Prasinococcus_capsulatus_cf.AAC.50